MQVEVSTRHPFKFEVRLDLTVLGVTMNNVGFAFDFKQAANSFVQLIDFLVGMVKKALGFRRRRDVRSVLDYVQTQDEWGALRRAAVNRVEQQLGRHVRTAKNSTPVPLNATTRNPPPSATPINPECKCFLSIEKFLQDGLDALVMVGELQANLAATKHRALATNSSFHKHLAEFSLESLSITKSARNSYDLSLAALKKKVTNAAIASSPLVRTLRTSIAAQTAQVVDMVDNRNGWAATWLAGLQNTTIRCGHRLECSGFADCTQAALLYLITQLERRQDDADLCNATNTSHIFQVQTGCSQRTHDVIQTEEEYITLLKETQTRISGSVSGLFTLESSTKSFKDALALMKQRAQEEAIFCGAPPTIHVHPVSSVYSTGAGLELHCAASGIPLPSLTWIKNGNTLEGKHSQKLSLPGLQVSDAGNYVCVASNSKGITTSKPAIIKV